MECKGIKGVGKCPYLESKVNEDFCKLECKYGEHLSLWKSQLSEEPSKTSRCFQCCWFHRCGFFCRLLTRQTNLEEYLKENSCPIENDRDESIEIREQPKAHPARHKNIFLRADKRKVDIVDLYRGQTAFICAGGKSFDRVDKAKLQQAGILTMALNNTGHHFRPTMWTGQDPQYRFTPAIWRDPKILKFTLLDYRFRYFVRYQFTLV